MIYTPLTTSHGSNLLISILCKNAFATCTFNISARDTVHKNSQMSCSFYTTDLAQLQQSASFALFVLSKLHSAHVDKAKSRLTPVDALINVSYSCCWNASVAAPTNSPSQMFSCFFHDIVASSTKVNIVAYLWQINDTLLRWNHANRPKMPFTTSKTHSFIIF